MQLAQQVSDYWVDACQRSVLLLDVMRQRGNNYFERAGEQVPNVLDFQFEPVMNGRDLPRPVNYRLVPVHAVSPGPLKTAATSGLAHFDELLTKAELRAPERDLVDILDIGAATAFLCSRFAKLVTGGTIYVDGGDNISRS
jgi:hypothetical protein